MLLYVTVFAENTRGFDRSFPAFQSDGNVPLREPYGSAPVRDYICRPLHRFESRAQDASRVPEDQEAAARFAQASGIFLGLLSTGRAALPLALQRPGSPRSQGFPA